MKVSKKAGWIPIRMRPSIFLAFAIILTVFDAVEPSLIASPVFQNFRNGVNGYAGTTDIQLRADSPDVPRAADTNIIADLLPTELQALVRFSDIFGNNPGQVPVGTQISSATLFLFQTDPGQLVNVHRMLVPWSETNTWNSFGTGVQPDGVEAMVDPDFAIESSTNGLRSFDVTATVQEWAYDPSQNFGWVFISTGGDGWRCASAEVPMTNERPMLVVQVGPPPCQFYIPSSVLAMECEPLTIGSSFGDCSLYRFQWLKDGAPIAGATNFPYMKPQANLLDGGAYRVITTSAFGSVTSSVCAVTISPDLVRPVIIGVRSDAGLVQITLEFSESMDRNSSENTSNYVLRPISGGAPLVNSNAILSSNGLSVILTTAPRIFKQSYSLSIQNVRNVGCSGGAQNLINPNPTVLTVHSDAWRLLDWGATWKYEDNTNLDNTGWQSVGYDDQAWYLGPGLFGFESQQATLATFPASIGTIWRISLDQPTYYARTLLRLPAIDWQDVLFQVRHVIDDGLVLHVNGAESFRVNMTETGSVTFTNLAVMNGDARLQTNYIALKAGTNVLAAEVHQATRTSGDIVFGAEVLAIFPPPVLSVRVHEGAIRLEWTPRAGTLEESSDMTNWRSSAVQDNPQNRSPSAQPAFFRVKR